MSLRTLAIVKIDDNVTRSIEPLKHDEPYLFLGEIPNFPGHGVIHTREGRVLVGVEIDIFVELDETEIDLVFHPQPPQLGQ